MEEIIVKLNNTNKLPFQITDWEELSGGTSSSVWKLLGSNKENYVLKSNECDVIKEEFLFLTTYQSANILPEVLYVDEEYEYFLYAYMSGEVMAGMTNKKDLLTSLVNELIGKYQPISHNKWGWTWELSNDWNQFLWTEIEPAKEIIDTVLTEDDFRLVKLLSQKDCRSNGIDTAYLLHGDCGVHNFLQKDGKLIGVIDPMALAGPPLYELVFAFCSSPEQLNMDVIYEAATKLPTFDHNKTNLIEEVLIGLYIRIARSIYHHPHDLPAYLEAWEDWKMLMIK